MKKLIAIAAVAAAVLGTLVTGPSPAAAHSQSLWHSGNQFWISEYHYQVNVCDVEVDSHYAYIVVEFADGSQAEERDGGDLGCDHEEWGQPFYSFMLCEDRGRPGRIDDSCTTWFDS